MAKHAWVFPGQGSQFVGMGKDLPAAFTVCADVFAQADEILGFPLSQFCFEGPEEELRKTATTQPAILTHSVAICQVLHEKGRKPDVVAGHSLGAYSALVETQTLTFSDALHLVRRRGELMEASGQGQGTMAVILGLDEVKVREACTQALEAGTVEPANVNSPGQIVISGHNPAVTLACEKAKALGAKRAIPLAVSGPFHSSLMRPAADEFKKILEFVEFRQPQVPYFSDIDAVEMKDPDAIKASLVRQLVEPVQWIKLVVALSAYGVGDYLEVGPGKVLNGLIGKILKEATVQNAGDVSSINAWIGAL
jgi:[acyl-carrier-protein] S-malonyltransferase